MVFEPGSATSAQPPWGVKLNTPETTSGWTKSARSSPADVNDDEVVNIDDLFDILAHWGEGAGTYDVNEDGIVDIDDVFDVLAAWGPCP